MPARDIQNPDPKDDGQKKLESGIDQTIHEETLTEEPPAVRELTQTDRINRRLLVSLLENMNKNQFVMGNETENDQVAGSSENADNDADWK